MGNLPRYGAVIPAPPEWSERAACVGRAPLHDPRGDREGEAAFQARSAEARAVCATCLVLRACRRWVQGTPRAQVSGTLAGHTFDQVYPGQPGYAARKSLFPALTKAA
ncbi:WhiB family transcriptional regulator [Dietzia maris]